MSYFITGAQTTTHVRYKLLDNTGKIVKDYPDEICFRAITYSPIPESAAVVHIYHEKTMVPYKVPEIRRWINDITEAGFAATFVEDAVSDVSKQKSFIAGTVQADMCELGQKLIRHGHEGSPDNEDKYYRFEIRLSDFKYKSHLISTLMLVRCLTETGICLVPDIYFEMLDKNPNLDKFDAIQTAHKDLNKRMSKHNYNYNHMITWVDNGSNVDRQTLLARYENCGHNVWTKEARNLGQTDKWRGVLN